MSADAAEPKKSSSAILPVAGALFLGVVIGAAMNSGDDAALKVKRDLEARVEAAESAAAAAIANAEAAANSGVERAAATVSELQGKLEAVAAEAAASSDAEMVDALNKRVQVLAEQMAAMISAMQAGGAMPAPAKPAAAPAEAEASAEGDPEALAAAIGESGLILAVGQTGAVEGARVFMSRIDAEAGAARLMVVGEGPTIIGGSDGAVTLSNGCVLTLEGVADRRAYISVACGG
jgi:hypothetical protein